MPFSPRSDERVPIAPAGDPAFSPLYDRRMFWPVQRARVQVALRDHTLASAVLPLERRLFQVWCQALPGAGWVVRRGLPRRVVEEVLGDALVLRVDPNHLIRSTHWRGYPDRLRPSSSSFIWDGEWDLRRGNLLHSSRYRFISDLDAHRDDLRKTERYRELRVRLDAGRPWSRISRGSCWIPRSVSSPTCAST